MKQLFLSILFFLFAAGLSLTQEPRIAALGVAVDQPGIEVSPSLYGIFFEEINLAGDGGIYPELIRNRSFEFSDQPDFWTVTNLESASATAVVETNTERNVFNQKSLRVDLITILGRNNLAIINEGYWGIPIIRGEAYDLTVRAKVNNTSDSLNFRLTSSDGKITYGTLKLNNLAKEWKTYSLRIKSAATDPKAKLTISPTSAGTYWLDYVSLKPARTYKNHGLRIDLMEKLAALKPAFIRFPGGAWVEGNTMEEASRWKQTIGPESERWTQPNLWGYKSTNGLGYHEYLQMCEDLGADAMFVINCGMSLKGVVPMDKMDEYVQDALDAIEYAVGSTRTVWGKKRAENGHYRPFPLKYLEIGNENGGPEYWARYDLFVPKIREKYPDIKIIANQWHGAVTNQVPIEIEDEHFYSDPPFFVQNVNKYDSYSRDGKKIYVGEYAVTENCGYGNLNAAIGEAVFMTGMERNSDVVLLSSYAPLFTNVNHRRWNPDLIVFDGTRSHGIPSYYVQQLFSVHRSSVIVPTTVSEPTPPVNGGCVGVGSWKTKVEYKDAKVEKNGETLLEAKLDVPPNGAAAMTGDWKFVNETLRQESKQDDCRYLFGDENWNEYTFNVKARKIDGEEGFLILFNSRKDGTRVWFNIGGWNNTASGLESNGIVGDKVDFKVEKNRWYDIRIEQKEQHVKCFIDDALILERDLPPVIADGVFAVSGLNANRDELIMKIVNSSPEPYQTTISLRGVVRLGKWVREIVLTSENGLDENTLDDPEKVSPKESGFQIDSPLFVRELPGKSLTVLRVKIR